MRSRFVHGTFEIIHPLKNEQIDENVDSQYDEIYQAMDFGLATLMASIRSLIKKNYREVKFDDQDKGYGLVISESKNSENGKSLGGPSLSKKYF